MSLFGALNTAISGLTSQSAAFGNVSDNVANSQTVGYKGVDTSFQDYLTVSTASENQSGSVVARPSYRNNVQGTISQSSNATALAIDGQGFFPVSRQIGQSGASPVFATGQSYTRTGDFSLDNNGYLVNSSGYTLNAWGVNATSGTIAQTVTTPLQISKAAFLPVPTTGLSLQANLPATPTAGSPIQSQVQVYDSLGSAHTVTLNWNQTAANVWTVSVNVPDDVSSAARGAATVAFGSASGNAAAEGTVGKISGPTAGVSASAFAANAQATISFASNFGQGTQTITLNLGTFGKPDGVTQFAGTDYVAKGVTQNGVPPGNWSGVTTRQNGDIVSTYDNGQTRVVGRVPVITFAAPGALQRQNGQVFTTTLESGQPVTSNAGANGAGVLSTSSVEGSNVDIATEFSKLIVAQRAYSANTKLITTSDELLQQTIDMKR